MIVTYYSVQQGIPYSEMIHKFRRTQDVKESVAWARKSQEESRHYELWKKDMKISNRILIVVGVVILVFTAVTPLPHGVEWRIIIGLLGCFSLVSGIYKNVRK